MALARRKGILDDYYQTREQVIDYNHDVSKRAAHMRLKGMSKWTKDDWKFWYALDSGLLDVDLTGPLWDPNFNLGKKHKDSEKAIKRGLFNPLYLFPKDNTKHLIPRKEDPMTQIPIGDIVARHYGLSPGYIGYVPGNLEYRDDQ